mmetsp:Transcript_6060/g.20678  ORF Transcript_6060/g.20678 Transcript_6060/m.20678 type:complete len:162 (+) Transcript_6060:3-488(+)
MAFFFLGALFHLAAAAGLLAGIGPLAYDPHQFSVRGEPAGDEPGLERIFPFFLGLTYAVTWMGLAFSVSTGVPAAIKASSLTCLAFHVAVGVAFVSPESPLTGGVAEGSRYMFAGIHVLLAVIFMGAFSTADKVPEPDVAKSGAKKAEGSKAASGEKSKAN